MGFGKASLTILLLDEWFVDDVMVVDISIDLVVLHVDLDRVDHRNEAFMAGWWPRDPVLREVGEHVDVVT